MPTPNYKDRFYRAIAQAVSTDSTYTYQASDIKAKTAEYVLEYYHSLSTEEREEFIARLKADLVAQTNADIDAEIALIRSERPISEENQRKLERLEAQKENFKTTITNSRPADFTLISQYQQMIFNNHQPTSTLEMWLTQEAMKINVMLIDKSNDARTTPIGLLNLFLTEHHYLHPGVDGHAKPGRPNIYYSTLTPLDKVGLIGPPFFLRRELIKRQNILSRIANKANDLSEEELLFVSDIIPPIPDKANISEDIVALAQAEFIASVLVNAGTYNAGMYEAIKTAPPETISGVLYGQLNRAWVPDVMSNPKLGALMLSAPALTTSTATASAASAPPTAPLAPVAISEEQEKVNAHVVKAITRQYLLQEKIAVRDKILDFLTSQNTDTDDKRKKLLLNARNNFQEIKTQLIAYLKGNGYDVEESILEQFIDQQIFFIREEIAKIELSVVYQVVINGSDAASIAILSESRLQQTILSKYNTAIGLPNDEPSLSTYQLQELSKSIRERVNRLAAAENKTRAWQQQFLDKLGTIPSVELVRNFDKYLSEFIKEHCLDVDIKDPAIQRFRADILSNLLLPSIRAAEPPHNLRVIPLYLLNDDALTDLLTFFNTDEDVRRNLDAISRILAPIFTLPSDRAGLQKFLIDNRLLLLDVCRKTQDHFYQESCQILLSTHLTIEEINNLFNLTDPGQISIPENQERVIELLSKRLNINFTSLFADKTGATAFITNLGFCQFIRARSEAIRSSNLEWYLSSLPIEALQDLISITDDAECALYLSRSKDKPFEFTYYTGGNTTNRSEQSSIKSNYLNAYIIEDDPRPPSSIRFSTPKKLQRGLTAYDVQAAAQRILTKRVNSNKIPQLEAFLPYPYSSPHILQAALDKRATIEPRLPDIDSAQWIKLFNATTEDEVRKALENMRLIPQYSSSTSWYFSSDAKLVKDILTYRQVFTTYDVIKNPALAKVFKRYYPDIVLTYGDITKINQFFIDHPDKLNFAVEDNRTTLLKQLSKQSGIAGLDNITSLHTHLEQAAAEIFDDHRAYLRSQEKSAEQDIVTQQITTARKIAKKALDLRCKELESSRRHEEAESDDSILDKVKRNTATEILSEVERERNDANTPENIALYNTFVMERMQRFLRAKSANSLSPNVVYDVPEISKQWLQLKKEGNPDDLRLRHFNQYMQDRYGVQEIPPFMTIADYHIIDKGYTLETALLEGTLETHIKDLRERMEERLGEYQPGRIYGGTYKIKWQKALDEVKRLYNNGKVKGVESYDEELTKLQHATAIGGGKESYAFAEQEEERIRVHQEHFERLIRMMEVEKEAIEKLKRERDECKAKYGTQIASMPSTQEAFNALSKEINDREALAEAHRKDYELYKKWRAQLKEIGYNIQRTLYDDQSGKRRGKADALVLERDRDRDRKFQDISKEDWKKRHFLGGLDSLTTPGSSASTTARSRAHLFAIDAGLPPPSPTPVVSDSRGKYADDVRKDKVRIKIKEFVTKNDRGEPIQTGSGVVYAREYDKQGKCKITGEWSTPILRATFTHPDGTDYTIQGANLSKQTIRYSSQMKQHEINVANRDAPENWVTLDVVEAVPLNLHDSRDGANDHNPEHRKLLAEQCFNAVTDMLIKGYLNQKQYLPNKADPMIITAHDKLAAEYLMAACKFYQAVFPDLLTDESFKFLGVAPARVPSCDTTSAWNLRRIDAGVKEEDKAYFNFDRSPSMHEFLGHLGYKRRQAGVPRDGYPIPLKDCDSSVIQESVKDCKDAILRAEEMKRVRTSQLNPKTKALSSENTSALKTAARIWRDPAVPSTTEDVLGSNASTLKR